MLWIEIFKKEGLLLKATTRTYTISKMPPSELSASDLILEALDDAKAEDILAIDLTGKTSLCDTMILASGRSQRHVGAIADQLLDKLKHAGTLGTRVEGMELCDWVLVDAGDVVVHIFRPEVRTFYNLEKMWTSERPTISAAE